MKTFVLLTFLFLSFASCKKSIADAQEDAVIRIMTSGQWYITKYLKANTDITNDFNGYTYQFFENRTVNALMNNAVQKSGIWQGNANELTIYAEFRDAVYPLTLLNGTFTITNSGDNFVEANVIN